MKLALPLSMMVVVSGSRLPTSSLQPAQESRPHLLPSPEQLSRVGLASETSELLHFLSLGGSLSSSMATGGSLSLNLSAMPPYETFMPACGSHVRKVVTSVDHSYSDEQLRTVLEHQCRLDKAFDHVAEDGFKHHDACVEFARQLSDARHEELSTGSSQGYAAFCADFFVHRGGKLHSAAMPAHTPPDTKHTAEIVAEAPVPAASKAATAEPTANAASTEGKSPAFARSGSWWKLCVVVLGVIILGVLVFVGYRRSMGSRPRQ